MNKVIIKGRLTADPELRYSSSSVENCRFTVAVDRYVGKDKEKEVDFIPCVAWRQNAVVLSKYFVKGSSILVIGSLHFDKYCKDGQNKTFAIVQVDSVEFCSSKCN